MNQILVYLILTFFRFLIIMNNLYRYIVIYLMFSFIGWLFEYLVFKKSVSDKVIKKLFDINIPTLQIYGLGATILFIIQDNMCNYSIATRIMISFVMINSKECVAGLLSKAFYGYRTWHYSEASIPFCQGYISVRTSCFWLLLISCFFIIADRSTLFFHYLNNRTEIRSKCL
jgi:uncharacterized membrane protein